MTEDATMKDESAEDTKPTTEEEAPAPPPVPPLEAAALRLDRLLGGSGKDKDPHALLHSYTNPAKVVRKWLGTSSGAAGNAKVEDIQAAAHKLLDPAGPSDKGRSLLISPEQAATATTTMDVDEDGKGEKASPYLSTASSREVESWLLSLAVRLLWRDGKMQEALDLAQKGIDILLAHIEEASLKITSVSVLSAASLFPLLARMYRLRSLVAESLNDPSTSAMLLADMTKAHKMAALRRDVDSQATLLNSMLRDLLRNSQGTK